MGDKRGGTSPNAPCMYGSDSLFQFVEVPSHQI